MTIRAISLILALAFAMPGAAQAPNKSDPTAIPEDHASPEWRAEKCRLYTRAWDRARQMPVFKSLSTDFVTQHGAFIAGGCTGPATVCPRSKEEFDFANMLVLMAMDEGMASTFLPFACPKAQP
ncbi:MAG: hypothetical protein LCH61_12595 [Proteobacteria bacterium]|nr:hypothetical protein [Pseudomonadota bacterium]